jgi:hypothetical protein
MLAGFAHELCPLIIVRVLLSCASFRNANDIRKWSETIVQQPGKAFPLRITLACEFLIRAQFVDLALRQQFERRAENPNKAGK